MDNPPTTLSCTRAALVLTTCALIAALVACTDESPDDPRLVRETGYLACTSTGDCGDELSCRTEDGATECVAPPSTCDTTDCACLAELCGEETCYDVTDGIVCGDEPDPPNNDPGPLGSNELVICPADLPTDPVTINSVALDGDDLNISVSVSGGCAEHQFTLCYDGTFLESNPVQIRATLAHDDMDDACDGILQEDLTFDLTPLQATYLELYRSETGTVIIGVVDGDSVEYSW